MIKRRTFKFFLNSFIVLLLVFVITWLQFLYTPVISEPEGYKYTVLPGVSLKSVIWDLHQKGIIQSPYYMQGLMRVRGDAPKLKAGEYLFPKGATPLTMLKQMSTGTGILYHTFTIIPGWTFKDVRQSLLANQAVQHTIEQYKDEEIMAQLGQLGLPEGRFYPDTYYFDDGVTDLQLLKRAYQAMQAKLQEAWRTRASGLPYKNSMEVLVAASLIEKEAYLDIERPFVASVLLNRLQKNMLLQIDPTVIYGMGLSYTGKLRKEDLLNNSPYNTYIHKGLPPVPIAMPGLHSINAAVHPAKSQFFYYVARGDGSHQFSETYSEHQVAISLSNKPAFFNGDLLRFHLVKVLTRSPIPL